MLTAGHTHASGYQIIKDGQTGMLIHCLQVASYKRFDRYAREMGLADKAISPSSFVVLTPDRRPEGRVQVFHDVALGVEYLRYARQAFDV